MIKRLTLILAAVVASFPCLGEVIPTTERTEGLLRELLAKMDSTSIYAARKSKEIDAIKAKLPGNTPLEQFDLHFLLSDKYAKLDVDSSLFYLEESSRIAREAGLDSLRIKADITKANFLAITGFHAESLETLGSIDRKSLKGDNLGSYYNAFTSLFHSMYSVSDEPAYLKKKYKGLYNIYRDSLLAVSDPMSNNYLRNMEKKEARAGNIEEARRYNDLRATLIKDQRSDKNTTRIYDKFTIAYIYEHKLTGEAFDDLLESAILEVESNNRDIASLLRVESLLVEMEKVKEAKKVSDHYFSAIQQFGSRQRRLDVLDTTLEINDKALSSIKKRNNELYIAFIFISLLVVILVFAILKINSIRKNVSDLNKKLYNSGEISKGYIAVVFHLYSSYIKRLDTLRTRIYTNLKKGDVDRALELTSQSGESNSEEMKELFNNFDSVFLDIFPDFIQTVNDCLKPEDRIILKKSGNMTTELRIIALTKLGINDNTKIAELLHCSVKTIYNLRYELKNRLAIPEEEFKSIISGM